MCIGFVAAVLYETVVVRLLYANVPLAGSVPRGVLDADDGGDAAAGLSFLMLSEHLNGSLSLVQL